MFLILIQKEVIQLDLPFGAELGKFVYYLQNPQFYSFLKINKRKIICLRRRALMLIYRWSRSEPMLDPWFELFLSASS